MNSHQQPGALDALIQDGLSIQGMGQHLDQLVHESVQDVLGGQLPDDVSLHLPNVDAFELPPMDMQIGGAPMDHSMGLHDDNGLDDLELPPLDATTTAAAAAAAAAANGGGEGGEDLEPNNSGLVVPSGHRPRRRAAAAAANFATDAEASDDESEDDDDAAGGGGGGGGEPQETGSSGRPGRPPKRRRGAAAAGNGNGNGNGNNNNNNNANGGESARPERRAQHMQGRFSGRLPTKDDERKLSDECQFMAPLLSEDGQLTTLPTIIRAMATGSVRAHLEQQREEWFAATQKLAIFEATGGQAALMSEQLFMHQTEVNRLMNLVASLEQQLAEVGITSREQQLQQQQQQQQGNNTILRMNSAPSGVLQSQGMTLQPVQTLTMALPMQTQAAPQSVAIINTTAAPQMLRAPSTANLQQAHVVQLNTEVLPTATIVAQQMLPDGTTQPVMVTAAIQQQQQQQQPPQTTVPVSAAAATTAGLLRSMSSAQLVDANGQPTMVAVVQQQQQQPAAVTMTAAAATTAADDPTKAAGAAATNLNEHAQHFAVTAKLHEAAKTEAKTQAQQLAAQAQQHAQASVQAAHQAEELKKTLAVLPDSQQAQQAAATVQNLEARAQAHASITTQVVAQARGMHEKAKAHENEEMKAITQASVLHAHAQSLQVSAQQLEAHQGDQQQQQQQQQPHLAPTAAPLPVSASMPNLQAAALSGGEGLPHNNNNGMNVQQQQQHHDLSRLPTTPLSTASGGAGTNLFGTTGLPASAPPAATMVAIQQQQNGGTISGISGGDGQQMMAAPPLLHAAPSGDHSAEVASLQQQIAVLHAQQAHAAQAQAQVQAAVAAVQVQQQHHHQQQQQQQQEQQQQQQAVHMHIQRVQSQAMLGLMQGSSVLESNNIPLDAQQQQQQQQQQQFQAAVTTMQMQNSIPHHQQQQQQHPIATISAPLEVPQVSLDMENLLSMTQPLVIDQSLGGISFASDMNPIVSIPSDAAAAAAMLSSNPTSAS